MADSIEVLRAALRYIEHTANGKQELLVEQMRNAIRALSPAGGDWVMVPRKADDAMKLAGWKVIDNAGDRCHQVWNAMLAASPPKEPGAALPTEADDLAMHAKLRDLLTGKSLYVMGREHAEDVRKPLYEISFGMVMEDKILFRSKDAGYITTRHTPEEQDPSGQTLAGAGGLSVLMEAAGDVLRADISGSRSVALIPRDRIEALRNAVASIEATSAGTTGDDSEDAARYRWLRTCGVADDRAIHTRGYSELLSESELDAAIDARRAREV